MDWTTLWAYLSGSVDEERLLRNQQPAPHGQGIGCRDRTAMSPWDTTTHANGMYKATLTVQPPGLPWAST